MLKGFIGGGGESIGEWVEPIIGLRHKMFSFNISQTRILSHRILTKSTPFYLWSLARSLALIVNTVVLVVQVMAAL